MAPLSRPPPSGAGRAPPAAAEMLLPRAGGAAGRALPPLAALSEVLRLERKRRTAIVFPLQKLERYLAPGTDTAQFRLFQPGLPALQRAEALFRSDRRHPIDYVSSAVRMDHAPPLALPEVRRALLLRPSAGTGLSCGGQVGWSGCAALSERCALCGALTTAVYKIVYLLLFPVVQLGRLPCPWHRTPLSPAAGSRGWEMTRTCCSERWAGVDVSSLPLPL